MNGVNEKMASEEGEGEPVVETWDAEPVPDHGQNTSGNHTETSIWSDNEPEEKYPSTSPAFAPPRLRYFPTMFGNIRDQSVTFCIDTSGSMVDSLDAVKEHLIEFLLKMSHGEPESMFNLVEFSTDVTKWSDKMVRCTPQTVGVAAGWIRKLEPKTGTNTLGALLTAFSDRVCDAVCLVTDGLPDQNPIDILDEVAVVAQNRPVHCYYIQEGREGVGDTDFLQDLAMETYGSFHVITVTKHGCIERVTPVYRADATAERIIRTTSGNIYPSNHKVCTMATTVDTPMRLATQSYPVAPVVVRDPAFRWQSYPWPLRYYLPYYYHYPQYGWSRYRPARAWMKHVEEYMDSTGRMNYAPGPGALLIGQRVLARRQEDGYFYPGTVKSQVLDSKFLVEFGPCRHGKYRTTAYQETFVHDIVSHNDALRHSILPGDKILAPWEPQGEKYAPGVVLEGVEKRIAQGGEEDKDLIVTFHTGRTATLPKDTAVWIPESLHERVTYELKLPSNVRKECSDRANYPEENLPGFPVSPVMANPRQYEICDSVWLDNYDNNVGPRWLYRYPHSVPQYPHYYNHTTAPCAVNSEDMEKLIPGTDMTKTELNQKVWSQINDHMSGNESRSSEKLLRKRDTIEENMISNKNVTLPEDIEAEYVSGDLEMKNLGLVPSDDEVMDKVKDAGTQTKIDVAVGRGKMYYRRKPGRPVSRPPWKYWNNDPTPPLLDPMHFGPYRIGPYEQSYVQETIETRNRQTGSSPVQWTGCMSQVVDPFAKHKHDLSVSDSLFMPKPPPYKPEKQTPGKDISDVLGTPLTEAEMKAAERLDFRRSYTLQREQAWQEELQGRDKMRAEMQDWQRLQTQQRLDNDQQKRVEELDKLRQQREAKRLINEQIRERVQDNQQQERSREEQRIEALRRRSERREDIIAQREMEMQEILANRQAAREQRANTRWEGVNERLDEEQAQLQRRDQQVRNAKLNRIRQFRQREDDAQNRKTMRAVAQEQQRAEYRSRIFP